MNNESLLQYLQSKRVAFPWISVLTFVAVASLVWIAPTDHFHERMLGIWVAGCFAGFPIGAWHHRVLLVRETIAALKKGATP